MKSKATVYILLAIIVIVFHEFILAMGYTIYLTSKQIILNDIPETFNNIIYKNDNRKAFDEYIKSNYGIVSETFELKNHYNRFWHISAPFIEKEFSIQLVKGKVLSDNFYKVLATDPKFQHMYSNWVKKQVGIEDENVELEFKGALKSSAWVGEKPYIDFNKITSLDNLTEDICKNTHNLYLKTAVIDNFSSSNPDEVLTLVKSYEHLLKPYVFTNGDNVLWFGVKLNDLVNDKNDPFNYDILFDYNTNEKKYFIYYENRPIENNKSEYITFE